MDLSILIKDTIVYIRVAGIIKTPRGLLFEKSEYGYVRTLGGKVMLNESSEEAIERELMEEIGLKTENPILCAIVENIYKKSNEKVHEICFVYNIDNIFMDTIPNGFLEIPIEEIVNYDIRPNSIIEILKNGKGSFKHIITK